METPPRGARTTSTPPTCSSASSSPAAPSQAPGTSISDFLTFLQSIIYADIGREELGKGMAAFWRKIVDEPDASPPEFWQLFLRSSLTALGEKCRPVCVGMTWRRLITAGAV